MNPTSGYLKDNILLSIEIIKALKNWHQYFLAYLALQKGEVLQLQLRNGIKFLTPIEPHTRGPWADIWVLKVYTPANFDINEKDIVVDIGTHIGVFSIFAALKSSQGKVYAYEPVRENFNFLNYNIKLNKLSNIIPFNLAVSGTKGSKKIFLTGHSETASLFGQPGQKFHSVKTIGLKDIFEDNNLRKINFLKIDCEGSEYDILFNTPKRYLSKIDRIAIEYHESPYTKYQCQDLETFLRSHNFKIRVKTSRSPRGIRLGMLYAWREK